jgi:hypothetical protein
VPEISARSRDRRRLSGGGRLALIDVAKLRIMTTFRLPNAPLDEPELNAVESVTLADGGDSIVFGNPPGVARASR